MKPHKHEGQTWRTNIFFISQIFIFVLVLLLIPLFTSAIMGSALLLKQLNYPKKPKANKRPKRFSLKPWNVLKRVQIDTQYCKKDTWAHLEIQLVAYFFSAKKRLQKCPLRAASSRDAAGSFPVVVTLSRWILRFRSSCLFDWIVFAFDLIIPLTITSTSMTVKKYQGKNSTFILSVVIAIL